MLYIFIYENVDDLYTSIDFTYIMYTNKDLHMHENIIIEKLKIDGKLITKRCTESYLQKIGEYNWVLNNTPHDFITVSDKVRWLIYGGGYCDVCKCRTKVDVSGRGFAKYCKDHFHYPKKGKLASNHKDVDIDLVRSLYLDQHKSILEISGILKNISNVTLKKKMVEADIPLRSHSDTQTLNSTSKDTHIHLFTKDWWQTEYSTKPSTQIATELGCSPSLVLQRLQLYDIPAVTFCKDTIPEKTVMNILDSIGIPYEKKVRGMLTNNKELDFLIPSYNLAIEVNGIYWHSAAAGKDSTYHLNKTLECNNRGIQLIHFWDSEVQTHTEIIRSMLQSKVKSNIRIFARKCTLQEVNSTDAKLFFNSSHMQGYTPASKTVGLFYDGVLVCAGSFSKPRFNKQYDWELIRFSSALGVNIIGGLSRILNTISGSIISYANRRWSIGNAYDSVGFKCIGNTKPSYGYTKDFRLIENRMKFQKHKLVSLPQYDNSKTESTIMNEAGYTKVWDCGHLIYTR
jgi:G:T-mismatch repair DNA endonuclease (very short patch repair protein)